MIFENLNLIEPILKALQEEGYTSPTPIQEQSIPVLLQGKDLLGCAQTGTGKTAAFTIPILQKLYKTDHRKGIKALILTPTRELAIQIGECFEAYGRYTGLKHAVIFGGVGQKPQTDALRNGVQILVATPGRLLDLITQGFISLKTLDFFVLDEADRMLDMGFIHDIRRILKTTDAFLLRHYASGNRNFGQLYADRSGKSRSNSGILYCRYHCTTCVFCRKERKERLASAYAER